MIAGKLALAVTGPAAPGPKLMTPMPMTEHGVKFETLRAGPLTTIALALPIASTWNDAVALDAGVPGGALFRQQDDIAALAGPPLRPAGAADAGVVPGALATTPGVGALDDDAFAIGTPLGSSFGAGEVGSVVATLDASGAAGSALATGAAALATGSEVVAAGVASATFVVVAAGGIAFADAVDAGAELLDVTSHTPPPASPAMTTAPRTSIGAIDRFFSTGAGPAMTGTVGATAGVAFGAGAAPCPGGGEAPGEGAVDGIAADTGPITADGTACDTWLGDAERARSNASARSFADWYRCEGSRASALSIQMSSAAGRSGRRLRSVGRWPSMTA